MKAPAFFLLLLFCSHLKAQRNDWSAIEQLQPGTTLQVVTRQRLPCHLVSTADDGMDCEWHGFLWRVNRDDIRRVILPAHKATVIGVVTGAAVAGSLAAALDHDPEKVGKPLRVGVAAALGGGVGFITGKIIDASRGRVIYQQP